MKHIRKLMTPVEMALIGAIAAVLFIAGYAQAQSNSNTKVGFAQGGELLFVKTGGDIQIRDVSIAQTQATVANIGTAAVGRTVAPFPGTISYINCKVDALHNDNATLTAAINGVAVTNGVVTVSSTGLAYASYDATPTALNTVAQGDIITMTSNGAGDSTGNALCRIVINP